MSQTDKIIVLIDAPLPADSATAIRNLSPRIELVNGICRENLSRAHIIYTEDPVFDPADAPALCFVQLESASIAHLCDLPIGRSGIEVGNFTDTQLAAGVNLALFPSPWRALAEKINAMSADNEEQYYRWQHFDRQNPPEGAKAEHQALWQKLNQVLGNEEKARQQAAVGQAWKWVLTARK